MKLKKEEFVLKVGSKIRELRMEKGLSIEKLANNAEIERKQLSRIELGEINTSIYQVYNISHTLEVPINDVFDF
ncbi:helix-turn-helix transcriptional regulator [Aquirufa sp. 5-AUSEE-100C1]